MVISLVDLPDDILIGIFFSGYLDFDWLKAKEYSLISKLFFRLARASVGKIVIPARQSTSYCRNLSSILDNPVYLDLSYSDSYESDVNTAIARWGHSLKSLVFRGINVTDDDIRSILDQCSMQKPLTLISLDISKGRSADLPHISDRSLEYLAISSAFRGHMMRWLNLSMTNISDVGIDIISHSFPNLELLGVQCCPRITDNGLTPLAQLGLTFLDFSGCKGLTVAVIDNLFRSRGDSPLMKTLVVLSCAHLSNFCNPQLSLILQRCTKLQRLDCRPRDIAFNAVPRQEWNPAVLTNAKSKLEIFVYRHSDLSTIPKGQCLNIVDLHPNYLDHWIHFSWPYYRPMEKRQVFHHRRLS